MLSIFESIENKIELICKDTKNVNQLRSLLKRNKSVNVNMLRFDGWSIVHLAVIGGSAGLVDFLLFETNANPTVRCNENGVSPLHSAAWRGSVEVVKVLLRHPDVEIDGVSKDGQTALHYAAWSGMVNVCKLLLKSGASDLVQNKDGVTPLLLAIHCNHLPVIVLLVEHAVQKHAAFKSLDNESPFSTVHSDLNGCTGIHHACFEGHEELLRYLLKVKGFDVHAKDKHGRTPLDMCRKDSIRAVVQEHIAKMEKKKRKKNKKDREHATRSNKDRSHSEDTKENNHTSDSGSERDEHKEGSSDGFRRNSNKTHSTTTKLLTISTSPHSASPANSSPSKPRGYIRSLSAKMMTPPQSPARSPSRSPNRSGPRNGPRSPSSPAAQRYREKFGPGAHDQQEGGADETDHYSTDEGRLSEREVNRDIEAELALAESAKQKVLLEAEYLAAANNLLASEAISRCWELCADSPSRNNASNEAKSAELLTVLQDHPLLPINTLRDANHCTLLMRASGKGGNSLAVEVLLNCHRHREVPDLPPAAAVNTVVKPGSEALSSAKTNDLPGETAQTADLSEIKPPVTAAVATPPVSIARCDVWLTDRHGSTALHHAVMTGNDEVVRLLLSRMGDTEAARFVQTRNSSGCSAVHLAAEHGHLSTLKLLIQYGGSLSALVSAQDNDGFTPLHFACLYSQPDIVHFLVSEAGAAIMSFNIAGELPQDLAKNSVIKRFLTATTQYHSSLNSTAVLTVESKIKTKNNYEAALNALTSAIQAADALKRSSQQQSQFNTGMSALTLKSPVRTLSPTKSKVFTKPGGTPKTPKGSQSARTLPDKYSDVNSSFITTTKVNTARTPRNTETPTKRNGREIDSFQDKTPQKSVFSFPSALFDSVLEESEPEDEESVTENNKYSSENNTNKPLRDATSNNRSVDRSITRSKGIKSVPKTRPAPAKLTEQSAALAQSLDAEHNATIFKQLYKTMVSDAKKQIASELEQHKSHANGKNKSVKGKNVNTQSSEVEKTAPADHHKPRSESLSTGNPVNQTAQLHHQQAQRQQSLPERKPSINRPRANSGSVVSSNMPCKVNTVVSTNNTRSSSVTAPSSQEVTRRLSQPTPQPSTQQTAQPQQSSSQPGPKKRETVGGTFSQNASKQPQSSASATVQPAARRSTIAFSNSTKPGPGSPKKIVGNSQHQANTSVNASTVTPFQQQRDTISTPEAQQLGRSIANFFQTANSADGGSVESSPPEARVVDLLQLSASSQESSPRVQSPSKVYDSADIATEDRNTTANAVPFSNINNGKSDSGVNERRNDNSVAVSTKSFASAAPTTPTAADTATPRRRSSLSLFSSIFPNFASRSQDTSHSKPPLSRASVPVHASGGMIPESEINTDHVELQVFIGTLNRILDLHVNSTKKMFYRWKHYRGNDAADIIQSRQFNRHPLGTRMQSFSSKPNGSVQSNNSNEYDDTHVMRAGTGIGVAGSGGYLGERSSRLPVRQQEPLEVDTTNPHIAFHTASPGSYVSISDLSASTPPQSQPNSEFNSVARSGTDSPYLPFKHAHSTPNTSYRGTNLSFANPYSPEKTLLIPCGKFLISGNEKLQLCYNQIEPLARANEVPLGAIYAQFSVSSREGMTEVDAWNFLLCFELAPSVVSKTQLVEFVRSTLRSSDNDSGATDRLSITAEVEPVVYNSPPPPNQRRFSVSSSSGGKKPLGGSTSGGHRRASMGSAGEVTTQGLNFIQFVKVLWLVSGLCGNQRQGQQTPEMQFAMLLYIMDSSGGRRKIAQANRTSTTIPSFSYLNTLVTK